MYEQHFSLREAPFSITPDSAFFYPHDGAQDALNTLLVALRSGEGFLKIVGELGCGKTVLCRQLLKILQTECVTAYIPNPDMGPDDLLLDLGHELGIEAPLSQRSGDVSRHQLLHMLRDRLLMHADAGRRVIVCIDEAQAMPVGTLESLRLLSNLETEKRKLLQLVLFGQPELDEKLSRPEIRQLLQRISFSEYLGPMQAHRVPLYLAHRLSIAALNASTAVDVFEPDAALLLAQITGGVPRLVNAVANKCLMLAYGENAQYVNARHVHMAVADTPALRSNASQRVSWWLSCQRIWLRIRAGAMKKPARSRLDDCSGGFS